MVYTPKLVSQNKSYLVNNANSPLSYQGNEGFNSSSQWLRRRFEQSQENSFSSEDVDQSSPLLMRGKSNNILASKARSTGVQPFNSLNPVYEQAASLTSTSPTTPTTPTTPQLQGLIGEQSRTPFQSLLFQPKSEINITGSTIRSTQSTSQQDTSRPMSLVPTPQNTTSVYQSQPRAYVPITQSSITPIKAPMYTGPRRTSDSTFSVLNNRFERQPIPIYSSGSNLIGRDISGVNVRITESPLVQSTPAPKPKHQQTPPRKVENVPYLARLIMIEQELPKNEYEVEKSNSVKTLFFNFCLGIFIIFLTSTKHFRQFENSYTNVIGYCMFCIPAFYILKVFYTNVQWVRKKKQIDQLREKLVKELEQNSSYDTSSFTISPTGRSQSSPRPSRSTTTPLTTVTPNTVSSSQSTILPSTSTSMMSIPYTGSSTSTSMMNIPYTGGSTSISTIIPSASSTNSFINAWGSTNGTPFPQRIPPTTKYRQAPYVTPSKIDEKLFTIGSISARLPPEPKPTDRET
ncbi:hypothetical protein C1645_757472 [Glomus cerebriforme]|uniref:Uncharacterized protein n=1 Tax=Glomus cerebriforme TaxID=658196 RepID=A0A397TDY0_9GLOM|nr:hypothetical protein C1645_757472 [Glomus cerebriforme]